MSNQMHIVALGSSFAAGPGLPPYEDELAGRSMGNYAHTLAAKFNARLTDLTVSGSTLLHVLSEPQLKGDKTYFPQLGRLPKDAHIVTITGGGNDLEYIGGLIEDSERFLQSSTAEGSPSSAASTPFTPEQVSERFVSIIDAIAKIAPRAQVVLVEYLPVLGSCTKAGVDVPLTEAQLERHKQVAAILQKSYRLAAQARPQIIVVPVTEFGAEHCLGAEEAWIGGFHATVPYHPNQLGMNAVAEHIYSALQQASLAIHEQL